LQLCRFLAGKFDIHLRFSPNDLKAEGKEIDARSDILPITGPFPHTAARFPGLPRDKPPFATYSLHAVALRRAMCARNAAGPAKVRLGGVWSESEGCRVFF
jgi:hypothetical protein